uniref:Uncharacterized protein n=1 Tax=Anguilla anguilla TaxID=7936 RepID=A0A0E9R3C8_ANGAN
MFTVSGLISTLHQGPPRFTSQSPACTQRCT